MAQVSNTFDSYDSIGNREDLSDVIYDISPVDTPFMSNIGRTKATNTLHEWQVDSLAAHSADNSVIEGDDATNDAVSATSRYKNYTQISDKVVVVSASMEAWLKCWCKENGVELLGTKLQVEKSKITGRFSSKNCYGLEKAHRIKEKYNLTKDDFWELRKNSKFYFVKKLFNS